MTPIFKDESTVFSIAPYELYETKPGIYPGTYRIPACTDQSKPQRLVVKSAMHLMQVGGRRKPIRIDTASTVVARAIVEDNFSAQMWSAPNCGPGLAWLFGNISLDDFMDHHKDIYQRMLSDQRNWFLARIKNVDNEWSRFKNHRVVSDIDRFAARALGLEPDWMKTDEMFGFQKCTACGTMNDPHNIICSNCRFIFDPKKFAELKFAGAN